MLKDELVILLLFRAEEERIAFERDLLCLELREVVEDSIAFSFVEEVFLCSKEEIFPESIMSTKLKRMKNCFFENILMNFILIINYKNNHFGIKFYFVNIFIF
jgi:hypothetical protein